MQSPLTSIERTLEAYEFTLPGEQLNILGFPYLSTAVRGGTLPPLDVALFAVPILNAHACCRNGVGDRILWNKH